MKTKSYKTLMLMPYLPLESNIKIDNLIFWSSKNEIDKYINDSSLREHILKLLACYKYHNKLSIENPTIITSIGNTFANPTLKTIAKIESIKNILLFAGVLENNSWSFITSDNLEVFYQRFNVGDESIATSAGSIHHIKTGGYKIDEVSFIKPEHINVSTLIKIKFKSSIIRAMEDCLINSSTDINKSRIIQSINPLFNSYRNSHEHSWQSRILLLIMAFELLFGETGRPEFRKNILKYSTFNTNSNFKTYRYPIYNFGKISRYEHLTLNEIWAEEFYKLRHKIIHGDTVYDEDFLFKDLNGIATKNNPHFYIAINFFIVCCLNRLKELGFKNIPHYIVNSDSKSVTFEKNISGIKNETFKMMNMDFYNAIMSV